MNILDLAHIVLTGRGEKNQQNQLIKDALKKIDPKDIETIKTLKSAELNSKILKQKKDFNAPILDYKRIMKKFLDSAPEKELSLFVFHHLKYGGHNLDEQQINSAATEIVNDVINSRTKPPVRGHSSKLHEGFLDNTDTYGRILNVAEKTNCRDPVKISLLIPEKVMRAFNGYSNTIELAKRGELNQRTNVQRRGPKHLKKP